MFFQKNLTLYDYFEGVFYRVMVLGEERKDDESGGVCRGFVGGSVVFFGSSGKGFLVCVFIGSSRAWGSCAFLGLCGR